MMQILAGTAKGVYRLNGDRAVPVLESRGVRDLFAAAGRLFAGTGAGLYVSDDGGATWTCRGLEDREVWQVRGGRVLYAGTAPAGLYRSDDGGGTWAEVAGFSRLADDADWCVPVTPRLPGRARAVVVHGADPERLSVGVEVGGIARTSDGGATWTMVLPGGNPDLHVMVADPGNPDRIYASTGYGRPDGVAEMIEGNAGVFRSDDGGASWRYVWRGVTPRYSRPMCIDPRAPHALTVASAPTAFSSYRDPDGAGAMLYRSDDGGESWRSLCDATHTPARQNIHGLVADPATPGGVLVGLDTGEVWRVGPSAEWVKLADGMPPVLSLVAI